MLLARVSSAQHFVVPAGASHHTGGQSSVTLATVDDAQLAGAGETDGQQLAVAYAVSKAKAEKEIATRQGRSMQSHLAFAGVETNPFLFAATTKQIGRAHV